MNVLIAEDDTFAANMYRRVLQSRGHKVTITSNGLECLQVYENMSNNNIAKNKDHFTPFDVVVLDYRMSKLDGLETARAILKINCNQRIIFASAYVRGILQASVGTLQKVVELIEKPFDPKTLAELIENTYTYEELTKINSLITDLDSEQATISGEDILVGLRRMKSIIGTIVLDALIREVQDRGIVFEKEKRYPARDLQSLLKSVFGEHAGIFLMRFFTGYFSSLPVNDRTSSHH